MFGWKEKEVTGRFLPYVPEGKKSEHHALRNRVLSGEGFHNVEALRQKKDGSDIYISISTVPLKDSTGRISGIMTLRQKKDGSDIYISISTVPLKDSTGRISGIMSVNVDITERKRTEEELRNTRDYLDKLFNYANAPIIVWDTEERITRFNHAFEHMTDFSADEVIGKELPILFPESSRDKSLGKIQRTLSDEYWKSVEIPILRKDGDVRIALWNSANIYAKDGVTVIATIAQGQDITERKLAEESLRRSEEKYRTMMESMNDAVYISSKESRIEYMNPRMISMVGRDATGELCHKTIYDSDEKCSWCLFDQVRRGKHAEYELANPKNNRYYYIMSSPIFHSGGSISKLTILRDITEIKTMEEQLQTFKGSET